MAPNKKRPNRAPGSTGNRPRPGAADRPAPTPPRVAEEPAAAKPAGNEAANYLVPGSLALLVVLALALFYRTRNQTPAEPTGQPSQAAPAAAPAPSPPPRSGNGEAEGAAPERAPQRAAAEERGSGPAPTPPSAGPAQNVAVEPVHAHPDAPDPRNGHFDLAAATAGLPAGADLIAEVETSMGTFNCRLMPDRAPTTVANFVGLARGLRDFWDPVAGRWTRRPFYDGSVFHRVIPGFMIQGGDILRSGRGDPGYTIPDENVTNHDEAGLMAMANRGPNTGGSQFFIQEAPRSHLNGSYSVFGRCEPVSLVERIARVPRTQGDQPLTPVYIQHVRIHR